MSQGSTKGIPIDTDPLLSADSDQVVSSQKAGKTYTDAGLATKQAAGSYILTTGDNLTGALNEAKGTDVVSGTTTNIGAATGNYIDITGTTTITAFDIVQAGTCRVCTFTGILMLTYNVTSLILPGAANITTAVGDVATFISLGGGNWKCVDYTKVDGSPFGPAATVISQLGLPTSTNLKSAYPGATFDGQGGVIAAGAYIEIPIYFTGTLTNFTIDSYSAADGSAVSGSITIDIKRSGASIIGTGNKPLLSSASTNTAALSGWTSVAVTVGDKLYAYVSVAGVTVTKVSMYLTAVLT